MPGLVETNTLFFGLNDQFLAILSTGDFINFVDII